MKQTKAQLENNIEELKQVNDNSSVRVQVLDMKITNLEAHINEINKENDIAINNYKMRIKKRDDYIQTMLIKFETLRSLLTTPNQNNNYIYPTDLKSLKNEWDKTDYGSD